MRKEPDKGLEPLSYASPSPSSSSLSNERRLDERECRHLATNCMQSGVVALACCGGLLCTDGIVARVAGLLVGLFVVAALLLGVDVLRRTGRLSTSVVVGLALAGLAATLVACRLVI
jgi:hypothetical protein